MNSQEKKKKIQNVTKDTALTKKVIPPMIVGSLKKQ